MSSGLPPNRAEPPPVAWGPRTCPIWRRVNRIPLGCRQPLYDG